MAELEKLSIVIEVDDKQASTQLDNVIAKLKKIESLADKYNLGKAFDELKTKIKGAEARLEQLEGQIERAKDQLNSFSTKGLDNIKESAKGVGKQFDEATQKAQGFSETAERVGVHTQASETEGSRGFGGAEKGEKVQVEDKTQGQEVSATASKLAKVSSIVSSIVDKIGTGFTKVASVVKAVSSAIGTISSVLGTVVGAVRGVIGLFKTLERIALNVVSAIGRMGATIFKIASAPFTPVIKGMQSIYDSFMKIFKQITKMIKMRIYRLIAKNIIGGFTTGLTNAYQWAKITGNEFASSMDRLATSALYLKNSLGAMTAPLLNALSPAIDFIIDKFVALLNVVNQVVARLTGRSTWIKAVKVPQEFASGLDNATGSAKALKKELITILGIDEINPMERMDDTGGGGGSGGVGGVSAGSMFTEETITSEANHWADMLKEAWAKTDFTEVGRVIGDKLNQALQKIPWDKIKNTAERIGTSIATFLNGLFSTPNLFTNIGKTLAEGLNTAFSFAYGFVSSFDWAGFGVAITDGINGFMANLDWKKIKATVITTMQGIRTAIMNAVNNLQWTGEGGVGQTLANGINTAIRGILPLVNPVDWSTVASKVASGINDLFDNVDWESLRLLVANGISSVLAFIDTLKTEVHWKTIGAQIKYAIIGGFKDAMGISPNENIIAWALKNLFGKAWNSTLLGKGLSLLQGTPDVGGAEAEYELWTGKPLTVDAKLNYVGNTQNTYTKNLLRKGMAGLWSINGVTNVPNEVGSDWEIQDPTDIPTFIGTNWKNTGLVGFPQNVGSDWKYTGNTNFPTYMNANWRYSGNNNFPSYMNADWMYSGYQGFPSAMMSDWYYSGSQGFPTNVSANWKYSGGKGFPSWILSGWQRSGYKNFPDWVNSDWRYSGGINFPSSIRARWEITAAQVVGTTIGALIRALFGFRAKGGSFYGGKWHSIPQYASGGLPAHGSTFIAGEAGAELVGHVGGRTEVLNQSQLASTMYSSVLSANASQNRLLQEQNNLLRELINVSGDSKAVVSVGDLIDGFSQKNRRDGRTVLSVGV